MTTLTTKGLHYIPFKIRSFRNRSSLIASSANGLIFVACENDVNVLTTTNYSLASGNSTLRKDKPLNTIQPNLVIPTPYLITWLSVNCNGNLLAICYQSSDGGSLIHLLNIQAMSSSENRGFIGEPISLSTPSAGAEVSEGNTIVDFAWSPTDPLRFALATQFGSLRMFAANPNDLQTPVSLVGHLANSTQVKCISWSPKGKQLAMCLTGIIPTVTTMNAMTILQVDPAVKIKRVIHIEPLLNTISGFPGAIPLDLLWTSSFCFLIAIKAQGVTGVAFLSALVKQEPTATLLENLTGEEDETMVSQYHMRMLPNSVSTVAVTWSTGGEDCILLNVPVMSLAAGGAIPGSLPTIIKELPLPSTKPPTALDIGVIMRNGQDPCPLVIGRISDGAVYAFELQHETGGLEPVFTGCRQWCLGAVPPPDLPSPPPLLTLPHTSPLSPSTPVMFEDIKSSSVSMPTHQPISTSGLFKSLEHPPTTSTSGLFNSLEHAPAILTSGLFKALEHPLATSTSGLFNSLEYPPATSKSGLFSSLEHAPATSTSGLFKSVEHPPAPSTSELFSSLEHPITNKPVKLENAVNPPSSTSQDAAASLNSGFFSPPGSTPQGRKSLFDMHMSTENTGLFNQPSSQYSPPGITSQGLKYMSKPSPQSFEAVTSEQIKTLNTSRPANEPRLKQESPDNMSVQAVSPQNSIVKKAATKPPTSNQLCQSVLEAAAHFTAALETQAAETQRAWDHLNDVFAGLSTNLKVINGGDECNKGVSVIAKSLNNMDSFLDVANAITLQLDEACQLSVIEQKASSEFVDRLHMDFEAYATNLRPRLAAGLDPEAAALLAALKKKSRIAESVLADLEDQVETLTGQVDTRLERRLRNTSSTTRMREVTPSSQMDKIHQNLHTNSRLIQAERSRVELISRLIGLPFDSLSISDKQPSSRKSVSAGGSRTRTGSQLVSLEREQRDANLFKWLVSSGDQSSVPVIRAPQAIANLLEVSSQPNMDEHLPHDPLTSKLIPTSKSPGQLKKQNISNLLETMASVPPTTLASLLPSVSDPSPPSSTVSTAEANSLYSSVPARSSLSARSSKTPPFPNDPRLRSPLGLQAHSTNSSSSPQSPNFSFGHLLRSSSASGGVTTPQLSTSTPVAQKPGIIVPKTTLSIPSSTFEPTVSVVGSIPVSSEHNSSKPATKESPLATIPHTVKPNKEIHSITSVGIPTKPSNFSTLITSPVVTTHAPTTKTMGAPQNWSVDTSKTLAKSPSENKSLFNFVSKPAFLTEDDIKDPSITRSPLATLLSSMSSSTSISSASDSRLGKPAIGGFFGRSLTESSNSPASRIDPNKTSPSSPTPSQEQPSNNSVVKGLFGEPPTSSGGLFKQLAKSTADLNGGLFGTPSLKDTNKGLFETASLSESSQGNLFEHDSAGQATQDGSGRFIQPATASQPSEPANSLGGLFGKLRAPNATAQEGIFGQIAAAGQVSSPSATSMGGVFGLPETQNQTAPSGLFRQTTTTTSSIFGQSICSPNFVSSDTSRQSAGTPGNLFGQNTSFTAQSSNALFGNPSSSGPALFGKLNQQSGGLFDQPASSVSIPGGLFGTIATSTTPGGLFGAVSPTSGFLSGQPTVSASAGLFAQNFFPPWDSGLFSQSGTAAANVQPSSNQFGTNAIVTSPVVAGSGLFSGAPKSGGLFGQPTVSTPGGLFAQNSSFSSFGGSNLFNQSGTAAANAQSSSNQFGTNAIVTSPAVASGGLFGNNSGLLQHVGNVGNLFAMSNLGTANNTGNQGTATNMFGQSTGDSSNIAGQGNGGLFGSSSIPASPGGMFSNSGGYSTFGAPAAFDQTSPGAHNALTFQLPQTGSPASQFNQSASPFSASNQPAAGGLFAVLGNSPGGASFGDLAQAGATAQQSPFGANPSFTQRRA